MRTFIKKISFTGLALFTIPSFTFASSGVQSGLDLVKDLFGQGLAQDQSFSQLLLDFIQLLLLFAGPLAVLFVVISGFYYITAGGNEEQAEKGKKGLVNAVIGIIIILLSYTIVTAIQNTISGP